MNWTNDKMTTHYRGHSKTTSAFGTRNALNTKCPWSKNPCCQNLPLLRTALSCSTYTHYSTRSRTKQIQNAYQNTNTLNVLTNVTCSDCSDRLVAITSKQRASNCWCVNAFGVWQVCVYESRGIVPECSGTDGNNCPPQVAPCFSGADADVRVSSPRRPEKRATIACVAEPCWIILSIAENETRQDCCRSAEIPIVHAGASRERSATGDEYFSSHINWNFLLKIRTNSDQLSLCVCVCVCIH